jgi:hypothetical protein
MIGGRGCCTGRGTPTISRTARLLHRSRRADQLAHRVVCAAERERAVAEEALEDDRSLLEPLDARRRRRELDPGVDVLLLQPSGTETDLQPSFREHVERRQLLGEHGGLPEVLREDGLGDPQRRGGVGDGLPGDERSERSHEVVGQTEGGVAELLDVPRGREQLLSFGGDAAREAEPERPDGAAAHRTKLRSKMEHSF